MNVQNSCFFKCKKNSYAYADIKGTYHKKNDGDVTWMLSNKQ